MATIKRIIHHEGYWRDRDKYQIPEQEGIFFVYESYFDRKEQVLKIEKLLFIGEGNNLRNAIIDHPSYKLWLNALKPGRELSFTIAFVTIEIRDRIISAYLSSHQPSLNHFSDFNFFHDPTVVISHGDIGLIEQVVDMQRETTHQLLSFSNVG